MSAAPRRFRIAVASTAHAKFRKEADLNEARDRIFGMRKQMPGEKFLRVPCKAEYHNDYYYPSKEMMMNFNLEHYIEMQRKRYTPPEVHASLPKLQETADRIKAHLDLYRSWRTALGAKKISKEPLLRDIYDLVDSFRDEDALGVSAEHSVDVGALFSALQEAHPDEVLSLEQGAHTAHIVTKSGSYTVARSSLANTLRHMAEELDFDVSPFFAKPIARANVGHALVIDPSPETRVFDSTLDAVCQMVRDAVLWKHSLSLETDVLDCDVADGQLVLVRAGGRTEAATVETAIRLIDTACQASTASFPYHAYRVRTAFSPTPEFALPRRVPVRTLRPVIPEEPEAVTAGVGEESESAEGASEEAGRGRRLRKNVFHRFIDPRYRIRRLSYVVKHKKGALRKMPAKYGQYLLLNPDETPTWPMNKGHIGFKWPHPNLS